MTSPSPEIQAALGSFGFAGVVCLLAAGAWAIVLGRKKEKVPYPYTFRLLAYSGLAMLVTVIVLSIVLPSGPIE